MHFRKREKVCEDCPLETNANQGAASISWNEVGLPQTVSFSDGSSVNYYYAADGTKLREVRSVVAGNSSSTTTVDWCGDLVLEKVGSGTRAAKRLRLDGAYVDLATGVTARRHFVRDHLGSVRAVVDDAGTVLETDDYYPLGGPLPTGSSTTLQPEKYQGKEWNPAAAFNVYDFGERLYDPALGRWLSQDPLAEKYYPHSPYLFCAGNPMCYLDPLGTSLNPIFNENGEFLGVDDAGFEGVPLFMLSSEYYDGISHLEALKQNNLWIPDHFSSSEAAHFMINYHLLQSRPDWDGVVTIKEGIKWAGSHPDALNNPSPENTLYIDASKINLGHFQDQKDENGYQKTNLFNFPNLITSIVSKNVRFTTYALGRFNYEYLGEGTSLQIISNDATIYDWNYGDSFVRNAFLFFERARTGMNDKHGFNVKYYGTNKAPHHNRK